MARSWTWSNAIRIVVLVVLGGIGAAAGFSHTHSWADDHGQHGWLAWADAVVIEGMAVVAGFEIRRDHAAGRRGRSVLLPQVVLVVAFLIQMTSQVAEAEKSLTGWLLAAMPALGFLTVVKLVMRRIPTTTPAPSDDQPASSDDGPAPADEPIAADPDVSLPPVGPVTRPVPATLTRLPATVRQTLTDTARQVHATGRPITADDVRAVIALPEPMLPGVINELNTTINNHPVHPEEVTIP